MEKESTFFERKIEKDEIIAIGKNLCTYVKDNNIQNLILLDRDARLAYIGLIKMWQAYYPNEAKPNIYFVSPYGFMDKSTYNWKRSTLEQEFNRIYRHLLKNKNRNTLLFDTCIHTGRNIIPVIDFLRDQKFTNLKIGVVCNFSNASCIVPHFEALENIPFNRCIPFDKNDLVDRSNSIPHSFSVPKYTTHWQDGIQKRREIIEIFDTYLNN